MLNIDGEKFILKALIEESSSGLNSEFSLINTTTNEKITIDKTVTEETPFLSNSDITISHNQESDKIEIKIDTELNTLLEIE